MKPPQFRTARNRLTRYSLACGYIELAEFANNNELRRVTLDMEHGFIGVTCYDKQPGQESARREYVQTTTLKDARKVFTSKCREYRVKFRAEKVTR